MFEVVRHSGGRSEITRGFPTAESAREMAQALKQTLPAGSSDYFRVRATR